MNRGSSTPVGAELFLIESIYLDHVKTKVFTSRAGFDAGLRAVKYDLQRVSDPRAGGIQGFRTYHLADPAWTEFKP